MPYKDRPGQPPGSSTMSGDRYITRAEAQDIADMAAEAGSNKSLRSTFALLGVDLDDFESVQDFRGDLQWIKSGRRISRAAGSRAGSSILGTMAIGAAVGIYDVIKKSLTGH